MKLSLETEIGKLHMVGPVYERRLKKLSIETINDLLYHKPSRYEDYSIISKIKNLQAGEKATVKGQIVECRNLYTRTKKVIQKATIADETGQIQSTWFNQPFIPKNLRVGDLAQFSGMINKSGYRLEMTSPEYEVLKTGRKPLHSGRLVPIYPETQGISSKWLRSRMAPLIKIMLSDLNEWIPQTILAKEKLLSLKTAVSKLHFPDSEKDIKRAKQRLAFDEMLSLQLNTQIRKKAWEQKKIAHKLTFNKTEIERFIKTLPFKLTRDQLRSVNEILDDIMKDEPMNRLLLGDVGSGKTVVAAVAIYAAHLSGNKSAIMAPTEILALQHEITLKTLLEPLKLRIATCTSSKKTNLDNFHAIVGTHALLYKSVKPTDFGLVVIDEQHRFGVEQRAKLIQKGSTPHTLTMTATPIPRTVALTIYGDLNLSTINQMPPGRQEIKTWVVPPEKRQSAYSWIEKRIKKGEQAFIVCPLIETSLHESMLQVKAAKDEYLNLNKNIFPKLKLGLLHGRLKAKEKDKLINKFRNRKTDILVSTPVVEVGIDIANATIMMIEGSERFGLAQLHQLRGRVGRGKKQSYCLLFTSNPKISSNSRLKALETAKSGPELADLDLKIRGPGEIYGIKQHGYLDLKFASFSDFRLVSKTKKYAAKIIENKRKFIKNSELRKKLSALEKHIQPN
jgi:ATP-dependent DNA helicase RecG